MRSVERPDLSSHAGGRDHPTGSWPAELAALPERYLTLPNREAIEKKYGTTRARKLATYFGVGDPLADKVAQALSEESEREDPHEKLARALNRGAREISAKDEALRALFEQVEKAPAWLDRKLLELGCRTHRRCGLMCGVVLGCCALPLAYRSAAGIQPLLFTQFMQQAPVRRMSETNRFFLETCTPGGLRPHEMAWKLTVRVRMIHAAIRALIHSKQIPWNYADYGEPINQVDLAATCLLFSVRLLQPLRRLGFHFSAKESEAVMHLWRYSGYLLGIDPESGLLATTEAEGRELSALLLDMAGAPDQHSIDLNRSLMETAMPRLIAAAMPWRAVPDKILPPGTISCFCYGLSHGILGNRIKSELKHPDTAWGSVAPRLLRWLIFPVELCRRLVPGGTDLAFLLGNYHLEYLKNKEGFATPPPFQPFPNERLCT